MGLDNWMIRQEEDDKKEWKGSSSYKQLHYWLTKWREFINSNLFHIKTLQVFYLMKNNSSVFARIIWLSPSSSSLYSASEAAPPPLLLIVFSACLHWLTGPSGVNVKGTSTRAENWQLLLDLYRFTGHKFPIQDCQPDIQAASNK